MSFLLIACGDTAASNARGLERALAAAMETGAAVEVDSVLPGDWQSLYVFGPYTPAAAIERCIGMRVGDHGLESRDDVHLIVLQMAPDHVASFTIPLRSANFDSGVTGVRYDRPVSLVACGSGRSSRRFTAANGDSHPCPSDAAPTAGGQRSN
jgi:hypothetical protein